MDQTDGSGEDAGAAGDRIPALGEAPEGYRSGFVAVVGLPNAGKSTLVNALLGREALITSNKPQTTRYQVRCISTSATRQIVFVDTPGWLRRQRAIDKAMHREIMMGLEGVDLVVYVVDGRFPKLDVAEGILQKSKGQAGGRAPVVVVVSKLDRLGKSKVIPLLAEISQRLKPEAVVPISSTEGENLAELDRVLTGLLPEGPALYPPEMILDRGDAFVVSEFLREQIFRTMRQEVPFSTAVEMDRFELDGDRLDASALIFVERKSQKGIVIGKGGASLKAIKQGAIRRVKAFLGVKKISLEIFVKVVEDWRNKDARVRDLGIGVEGD